jgi:phosphonate transport system ATP-binding protein
MTSLREIRVRDQLTVICNLHTLDTARTYCDRVIGMHEGRIVFDDEPSKLTPEVVRDVYGADQELDESVTSTSLANQELEDDSAPVKIQLAS